MSFFSKTNPTAEGEESESFFSSGDKPSRPNSSATSSRLQSKTKLSMLLKAKTTGVGGEAKRVVSTSSSSRRRCSSLIDAKESKQGWVRLVQICTAFIPPASLTSHTFTFYLCEQLWRKNEGFEDGLGGPFIKVLLQSHPPTRPPTHSHAVSRPSSLLSYLSSFSIAQLYCVIDQNKIIYYNQQPSKGGIADDKDSRGYINITKSSTILCMADDEKSDMWSGMGRAMFTVSEGVGKDGKSDSSGQGTTGKKSNDNEIRVTFSAGTESERTQWLAWYDPKQEHRNIYVTCVSRHERRHPTRPRLLTPVYNTHPSLPLPLPLLLLLPLPHSNQLVQGSGGIRA
jgi:hypothetical protein